ncbi:MAG TPA: PPOX class F420-dependent oxidoreductase [Acidimicrobiia bacterium]|nr:PPOX class F420-dependent oxidoreductase [Acidimicrobiia bacterium]
MTAIPDAVREVLTSGRLAHLVTLNPDGSPQVTCIWVGVEDDEIVSGHLMANKKVHNVQRDPRVVLSIEAEGRSHGALDHFLVVKGTARITEGGAAELLQRLAHVYLGPEVRFPTMDDPPAGYVMRTTIARIGGVGPWTA